MKTGIAIVASLVSIGIFGGNAAQANDAIVGAIIGGGTGALIGQSLHGRDGAIVGGAVCAAAGIALATDRRERRSEYAQAPNYRQPIVVSAPTPRYERYERYEAERDYRHYRPSHRRHHHHWRHESRRHWDRDRYDRW